ncbi:MAG: biotin--[acetyl-CoA-carboxylase] ligase [Candidatus Azobacteroides sp.]|nr:biotin--[acetyl-CoA-carboxylase] ligase [Candidatus Azobacteroides sp.]
MNIIPIEKVTSTNDYLKELAHKEVLEEGTVVVTANQTEGKGQRGNVWESEAGKNITCSILLYPSFLQIQRYFLLSEVIGLGVKETLDAYVAGITVKWPNDVYYDERKIAGILIENELVGNEYKLSVAGIGININQERFLSKAPRPVSLKQITGRDYDTESILLELIQNILYRYERLKEGDTENLIRMYHDALYRRTGFHRYKADEEIFYARMDRVSDDGFLHLVTEENEERSYAFKNVRFL